MNTPDKRAMWVWPAAARFNEVTNAVVTCELKLF